MKSCAECDPAIHEGGCNWLDWMVEEAGGVCPHCGGPVTEIDTVTPLGRALDSLGLALASRERGSSEQPAASRLEDGTSS